MRPPKSWFVVLMGALLVAASGFYITKQDAATYGRDARAAFAALDSCRPSSKDIEPIWQRDLNGFNVGVPVITNGSVYVGVNGNTVYAVDASTGTIRWTADVADSYWPYLPLAADGNGVYAGGGGLYALDSFSGEELWRFEALGIKGGFPTVEDGTVYIGARDFYAIEARTGELFWSIDFKRRIISNPGVASGVVYVPSGEGSFVALHNESGEELWRFDASGYTSPIVHDIAYLGGADGVVYALDAATGLELWRFDIGFSVSSAPLVSKEYLYIASGNGNIYALDLASGKEVWRFATHSEGYSSAAMVDDIVFVASSDCGVYAIDANTGEELWWFSTDEPYQSSIAVDDQHVYVGTAYGILYALPAKPFLEVGGNAVMAEDGVVLRAAPSPIGLERGVGREGEDVEIVGGPEERDGTVWWEVELPEGASGWVLQESILPTWP